MASMLAAGTVMVRGDETAKIVIYHNNKSSLSNKPRYLLRRTHSHVSVIPLTEKQLREAGWHPRHEKKK